MKALITGISGFAGSHLAEFLLNEQVEVFGLIRRRSPLHHLNSIQDSINLVEGDLYVTVTKRNYRPLEEEVPVFGYGVELCGDLNYSASSGDTDYSISVCVDPIDDCCEGISGTLTSSSDLVDIIISESDLSSDQLNFVIDISQDAIYGDDLNLVLELSDNDNNNWEIYLPFLVNSPKIDVLDLIAELP